ncbi:MAG: hypothetical protein AAF975_00025 [Spirochaetota bacterium]
MIYYKNEIKKYWNKESSQHLEHWEVYQYLANEGFTRKDGKTDFSAE